MIIWLLTGAFAVQRVCVSGGSLNSSVNGYLSTTECFNSSTHLWEMMPSLSMPAGNDLMTPLNLGGISCLVGGSKAPTRVICTNGSAPWVNLSSISSGRYGASAIYGKNWVGVTGGRSSSFLNATIPLEWTIDPTSLNLSWSSSSMSQKPYSTVVNLNGTSCVSGGSLSTTSLCLDQGTWVPGPNLKIPNELSTSLLLPGQWCVAGGLNDSMLNSVECISTTADFRVTNYTLANFSLPTPIFGAANVTIDGLSCVAGGSTDGETAISNVRCANLSVGNTVQWLSMSNLTARYFHASWTFDDVPPTFSPTTSPTFSPTISPTTHIPTTSTPTFSPTSPTTTSPLTGAFAVQRVCVSGGYASGAKLSTTECYNSSTHLWEMIPSLSMSTLNVDMTPLNLGGISCLVGGDSAPTRVICTNGSAPWFNLSSIPSGRTYASAIYGKNWVGITSGGNTGFLTATIPLEWTTDPTALNLSWSSSSMGQTYSTTVVNLNGTSCVTGGFNPGYLSTSLCLDQGIWVPGPNLRIARAFSTSLLLAGQWCVAGGNSGGSPFNSIECISTIAGFQVTNYTLANFSLPTPILGATNVTISGFSCVAGGTTDLSTSSPKVWCANLSAGNTVQWLPMSNLITARDSHASWTLDYVPPTFSPTSSPTATPTFSPTLPSSISLAPTSESETVEWSIDDLKVVYPSQWTIFQVQVDEPSLWEFSNNAKFVNQSIITFPPYTFVPGNYTFNVTIDQHQQTYLFQVVSAPLVANIVGGDKEVCAGELIALDANHSYDPDSSSSSLEFLWTICPSVTPVPQLTNLTSSILIIQATLPSSALCTITVTVSSNESNKSVDVSTDIRIVNEPLITNITIIASNTVISPGSTLRLLASVSNLDSLTTFMWTSLPKLSCLPPQTSTFSTTRALVVNPGCLQAGEVYHFIFTTGNGQATTQAWINVTVVSNPTGGECAISPLNGAALSTMFHVNCSGWSGSPVSLTYSLNQLAPDGSAIALSDQQYNPTFDVVLDGDSLLPVNLFVTISSLEASTDQSLSAVTLTTPLTCPLPSPSSSSIQILTTIVGSPSLQQVCQLSTQRQALWDALWNKVGTAVNDREFIDASSLTLLSGAISSLLQAIANSLVEMPTDFLNNLENCLDSMYSHGDFTVNSTQAMLRALPATIATAPCSTLKSGLSQLMTRVQELTKERFPGESPIVLQASSVNITTQNFFSDQPNSLSSDQTSLNLPVSLLMQGGEVSTITVTDYGSALANCLREDSPSATVVGGITDISLSNFLSTPSQSSVNVKQIAQGFSFSTPITGDVSCGLPQCAWWDPPSQSWSKDGCQTVQSSAREVTCVCTHLTEFSIILRPGCVSGVYRIGYFIILALYCVVVFLIIDKVAYYWYKDRPRKRGESGVNITIVLWQHFMLALLSISRIVSCALLASNRQDWTLASRAVILLLPYMIEFWIWTLLSFQWAAIYHSSEKSIDPFRHVRWVFLISNVVIVACVIATIVGISDVSQAADSIVIIAAGLIVGVTLLTAFSFAIYSIALHQKIYHGMSNNERTTRWLIGALLLSILFSLEAIMHLTSALLHRGMEAVVNGDASEVVVLVADLCCITVLLSLYHRALHPPRSPISDVVLSTK